MTGEFVIKPRAVSETANDTTGYTGTGAVSTYKKLLAGYKEQILKVRVKDRNLLV